jgi:hypothetical protein
LKPTFNKLKKRTENDSLRPTRILIAEARQRNLQRRVRAASGTACEGDSMNKTTASRKNAIANRQRAAITQALPTLSDKQIEGIAKILGIRLAKGHAAVPEGQLGKSALKSRSELEADLRSYLGRGTFADRTNRGLNSPLWN